MSFMRDVCLGLISNPGRTFSDHGHVRILQSLHEWRALPNGTSIRL